MGKTLNNFCVNVSEFMFDEEDFYVRQKGLLKLDFVDCF